VIRLAALAVAVAALAGCTPVTEIKGPGGQTAHLIECGGLVNSFADCYEKANEVCPAGYAVLNASQYDGGTIIHQYGASQVIKRDLIVQCST